MILNHTKHCQTSWEPDIFHEAVLSWLNMSVLLLGFGSNKEKFMLFHGNVCKLSLPWFFCCCAVFFRNVFSGVDQLLHWFKALRMTWILWQSSIFLCLFDIISERSLLWIGCYQAVISFITIFMETFQTKNKFYW